MTDKADIWCLGRVDGTGAPNAAGSYIQICYQLPGAARNSLIVSEGRAELLAAEIAGVLAEQ